MSLEATESSATAVADTSSEAASQAGVETEGSVDANAAAAIAQSYKIGGKDWQESDLVKRLSLAEQYEKLHPEFTRRSQELSFYRKSLAGLDPREAAELAALDGRLKRDKPFAERFFKALKSAGEEATSPARAIPEVIDENDPEARIAAIVEARLQKHLGPVNEFVSRTSEERRSLEAAKAADRSDKALVAELDSVLALPEYESVPRELVLARVAAGVNSVEEAADQVKAILEKIDSDKQKKAVEAAKARTAQETKKVEGGRGAAAVVRKGVVIGSKEHEANMASWVAKRAASRAA